MDRGYGENKKQLVEKICDYLLEQVNTTLQNIEIPPVPAMQTSFRNYIKPGVIKFVDTLPPLVEEIDELKSIEGFVVIKKNVQRFAELMGLVASEEKAIVVDKRHFNHVRDLITIVNEMDQDVFPLGAKVNNLRRI